MKFINVTNANKLVGQKENMYKSSKAHILKLTDLIIIQFFQCPSLNTLHITVYNSAFNYDIMMVKME